MNLEKDNEEIEDNTSKSLPELPEDFVEKALTLYHNSLQVWEPVFAKYWEDQRFANGDQWDAKVKQALTSQGLSALVYNQLPSKIKYIVNNARANTPAIKVNPVSNSANPNTAKVFDGIIKHLSYKYNAKHSYINALNNIVIGGIGAWKILPVETDEDGFDLKIERIIDPTTVIMDPTAITQQDFSSSRFAFVRNWMALDEFKRLYPDADASEGIAGKSGLWNKNSICVLEYWCYNEETKYFEQYLLTQNEVLEENRLYRGKHCPIVFITGEEKHIEGDHEYKGIVRDVRDMQIMLNLAKSKTADYIARSTNIQWKATVAQLKGHESVWANANTSGVAVLPYNGDSTGSPERLEPPTPPTGYMQASAEADADIRSAIGIRDPLAEVPTSQSGKAIALQISQGNIGTFEYMDKINEAIKYTGTVLVDLIPHYFNYEHVREIMGLDGSITTVPINQPYEDNGKEVMHDLTQGKYSVTISDGPSYESQRSEAKDMLLDCVAKVPQFMQLAGDIVFQNMDFDGAKEIAARLKATIPPNILAASNATNGDDDNQIQVLGNNLAQMQEQMQQVQQIMQQKDQQIQQLLQQQQAKVTEIQTRGQVEKELKEMEFQHDIQMLALGTRQKTEVAQVQGQIKQEQGQQELVADLTIEKSREEHDTNMHTLNAHKEIFTKQMDHDLQLSSPSFPLQG